MGNTSYWLPAAITLGATGVGVGLILLLAQERTRTNVSIGVAGILVGLATATTYPFIDEVSGTAPGLLPRLQGLLEVGGIAMSAVYMSCLLATAKVSPRAATIVRWTVRCALALAAWHAFAVLAFPAQRFNDYYLSAFDPAARATSGFWLFAGFWVVVVIVFVIGYVVLATQRLDHAETDRAVAAALSSGFIVAATLLPPAVALGSYLTALIVTLWGQLRHAVAGARRAVFLSRFLSPRVTELVHAQGLAAIAAPHQAELSVVSADLRSFTSYAEGVPSQAVVDLLTEYYDVTGEVVARHGGTITDYAGDGILILVGAPLPRDDHADVALALARELHVAMQPVLDRWATKIHPLGLGIGVASGAVTVGTIGASGRMEYTAIGTPVNVAARLCSAAGAGEVLVNEDAARLGTTPVVEHGVMPLKGLTGDQVVFALDDSADPAQVTRGSATLSTEPGSTAS
jgi:class 3 adenylate cyclase